MFEYQDGEVRNYQVYIHQNKVNGKMYCGQTCKTLKQRSRSNGKGYDECPRFYNAIQKYGWDNFNHFTLIDGLTKEEADIVETEIIKKYHLTDDHYGYNINEGGSHPGKPTEDLSGRVFGRLTVLQRDYSRSGIHWLCECSCSDHNIVIIANQSLLSGATKSCGCIRKEQNKIGHSTTHGLSRSMLYTQWRNMIKRTDAKDNIIDSWYDFNNFYPWAFKTGYKDGDVIIRIDRKEKYSPDNCKWGTLTEYKQTIITKNKNLFEYNGELYTSRELSELFGIPLHALDQRLRNKSFTSMEDILTTEYRYRAEIINTYDTFDDYSIIHIPNHDIIIDNNNLDKIKEHIWIYDNGFIIEKHIRDKPRFHLLPLIIDVLPRHIKRININYKNGNCFDLRNSNIELLIPDVDDYLYYISHIDVNGFVLENKTWRIGKKGEFRKGFYNNFIGAMKYYDERYGTNLYDEYKSNHT